MKQTGYLSWAIKNTKTVWWHDSAEPGELERGIQRGAVGATTNPFLSHLALSRNKEIWAQEIDCVLSENLEPETKAERLMGIAITHAAKQLEPEYEKSGGAMGYVCAQVNPARAGDRDSMLPMARRFSKWAPNIAVKLPATAAGLDVLEDCTAEGITCTLTISYTVPQVIAIAERYRQGIQRAKQQRRQPGKCFAVIMIGRLDDYLRDVAHDCRADISESDICQAGLAVSKRAYSIYKQRGYEAKIIVAALRGTYHMTELTGAEIIMSIAPPYQEMLLSEELPREERIDAEIGSDVIERLSTLTEFVRAYEPDGMKPEEFITYGVTQKTLAQFYEGGWKLLENFE
ncbi:MAG: transaldolase family protein [Sedimentisphaerales bacterium]|nr:transaldolase family protein [Sedimentisphaerales bacterium]